MASFKNAIFMIFFVVCFSSVIAEVNITTPNSPVPNGYAMTITWLVYGQPPTQPGNLTIINIVTGDVKIIDNQLNIASLSKIWNVTVVPGNYVFSINDGKNITTSGQFTVSQGIYSPPVNTPRPSVVPTVTIVSDPTNVQAPATVTVAPGSISSSKIIIIVAVVGSIVGAVIIGIIIWLIIKYLKNREEVLATPGTNAERLEMERNENINEYQMPYKR
ncbi:hypothetical protein F8M41_015166 [Gigaspora margarita]|uniref:Mid2 domain-containing protein n=2 Tax=Gigaspora margarita TaxID=4874 RepID=A0A8H3WUG1_GIGMA|nr:hypothetical protein F8M41_015166 [Gigaspora margarita]